MFNMPKWGGYLREWRRNAQADGGDSMSILMLLLLQCQEIATVAEAETLRGQEVLQAALESLGKK